MKMLTRLVNIQDSPAVKTTDLVVATGAITFPLWRERLHEWSAIAADVTPFFAIVWMLVQIVSLIIKIIRAAYDDG